MTDITLGIPMFRSAQFLPELFDRLRRLTPCPREIIFFDDASPDDSHRLAADFASNSLLSCTVKVLRNEFNGGIAAAYNALVQRAESSWVHILDADDFPVESDFYARIQPSLLPTCDIVVTAMAASASLLSTANALCGWLVPTRPARSWPLLGSFATRSGVVYRRSRVIEQPFPDPAYPGSDVIHLLALHNGINCVYCRSAHVYYRIHANATSSQARSYQTYIDQLRKLSPFTRVVFRMDLELRRLGQRWTRM